MCLVDEKRLFRSLAQAIRSDLRNAGQWPNQQRCLRHFVGLREGTTNSFGLILDDADKRASCAGRAARTKLPLPYSSDSCSNQGGELVL